MKPEDKAPIPNPGSIDAHALGCQCPIIDNYYGAGLGEGRFWINAGCPIHAMPKPEPPKEPDK